MGNLGNGSSDIVNTTFSIGNTNQGKTIGSVNLPEANISVNSITFSDNSTIKGIDNKTIVVKNGLLELNPNSSSSINSVANVSNLELTSTSATSILSYTPTSQGNYMVMVYYSVITAATDLTLTLTWTDSTGSQSYTWVNDTSQDTGSYNVLPVFINSIASAITVTATAGTANQVYVSGSIIQILNAI